MVEAKESPESVRAPMRLAIVDAHELTRKCLRNMLADEKDLEVVGEAANGRQALSLCSSLQPDVILMDVRMPEMDGVAATKEINRGTPHQRHDVDHAQDPDYLLEALKAGRRDTCSRTRPRRR
jgi:NarL family two-component system response regulator LiaR